MDIFQFVKSILDELYAQLPLSSEEAKDEAIRNEIKLLRDEYPELAHGNIIDYSHPITRFAYMYSYVTAHAYTIYALIRDTPDLSCLFNMDQLRVCCLGGGPGSDLLGMLKFIKTRQKSSTLMCRVYDRQDGWRESLGTVCNKLTSCSIVPTFRMLDVTDPAAWAKYPEISHNNLFTMSYLVSEVCLTQAKVDEFLMSLFKNADNNSLFLFVDNRSGYASRCFDRLVKGYNNFSSQGYLESIRESNKYCFQMEDSERVLDLEPYYSKYCEVGVPKLSAPVDLRIYRKARKG